MAENKVIWRPCSNTQYDVLIDKTPLIGMFSGRGTGKSQVAVVKALMNIGKYGSDYNILVLRETYPALNDLKKKFLWMIERLFTKDQYSFNGSDYRITFKTGEAIQFSYLDASGKGLQKILGHEYQCIIIDEIVSIADFELIQQALMTLRSPNPNILKQVIVMGNPTGRGFSEAKKAFYSVDYGQHYNVFGMKAVSYYLRIEDNPYIFKNSPEYVKMLESLPPHLVESWRYGRWVQDNETIFFNEFSRTSHVLEPFEIPEHWDIERGFDWGSASPFAYLLMTRAAEDYLTKNNRLIKKNSLIFFQEWYGCRRDNWKKGLRLTAPEIATGILKIEHDLGLHDRVLPGGCDIAVFAESGFAKSIGQCMADMDVDFSKEVKKGKGSRETGWEIIKTLMKESTNPVPEEPGLYIFPQCKYLIQEIEEAVYDPKKVNDLDTTQSDHALDAMRAMCNLGVRHTGDVNYSLGY